MSNNSTKENTKSIAAIDFETTKEDSMTEVRVQLQNVNHHTLAHIIADMLKKIAFDEDDNDENPEDFLGKSMLVIEWDETKDEIDVEVAMVNVSKQSMWDILTQVLETCCEKMETTVPDFMMHHILKDIKKHMFKSMDEMLNRESNKDEDLTKVKVKDPNNKWDGAEMK